MLIFVYANDIVGFISVCKYKRGNDINTHKQNLSFTYVRIIPVSTHTIECTLAMIVDMHGAEKEVIKNQL